MTSESIEFINLIHRSKKSIVTLNRYDLKLIVIKSYIDNRSNEKEIEILKLITTNSHERIIKYLDIDISEPFKASIPLEPVLGGSLSDYLRIHHVIEANQANRLISEVISACIHLFRLGFIHRDIKASNCLLESNMTTDRAHIKLCDFGNAIIINRAWNDSNVNSYDDLPRAYSIVGTPHAMAPELVNNEGYTYQVDWWSIGILLYEMVIGNFPFSRTTDFPNERDKSQAASAIRSSKPAELMVDMYDVDDDREGLEAQSVSNWDIQENGSFVRLSNDSNYRRVCSLVSSLLIIQPEHRLGITDINELLRQSIINIEELDAS